MKIAVAGHICPDVIPEWNRGGIESIIPGHILGLDGIIFSTGGAVANTGLALIKLGIETALVGKIGEDTIGSIIYCYRYWCLSCGVSGGKQMESNHCMRQKKD